MTARTMLPYGDRALLVEVRDLTAVMRLSRALRRSAPEGVTDIVPAARTILLVVDPSVLSLASLRAWVASVAPDADDAGATPPRTVTIPVTYDGEDLSALADTLGVAVDYLVRAHRAAAWTVAFTGFAPGFGYLVSEEWRFDVPRREAPRSRVPSGSVALAGRFSGVYPRSSPGGWQLIGRTDVPLFTPTASSPTLLGAGDRVRFRAADASAAAPPPAAALSAPAVGAVEIIDPGPLALLQDGGRPGHLADGISRSGAFDAPAAALANRLVGNDEDEATIEVALGGFRARTHADVWVAFAGTDAELSIGGRRVDPYVATAWHAGDVLELRPYRNGLRGYLAVRGGFEVPRVLGSAATDTLSGIGPARLAPGVRVRVGTAARPVPPLDIRPWGPPPSRVELRVAPGPRRDWLTPAAQRALFASAWFVSATADRVGVRLDGPRLEWQQSGELPSEAVLPGAIQMPPSGQPIVFGPDAPATGGYPVVGVVVADDLPLLAQARPGTVVRFRNA